MSRTFARNLLASTVATTIIFVGEVAVIGVAALPASADSNIYGTDSLGPTAAGSSPTYLEPGCTQYRYRVYMGQFGETLGTYTAEEAPGTTYNNQTAINEAYTSEQHGYGFGAGTYYWMGGIASSGLTQNASNATWWGGEQAANAISYFQNADALSGYKYTSGFIFADVESGQGWSSNTALNQDTWNGFVAELQNNGYNVGAYSSPSKWSSIMGNLPIGQAEWTSTTSQSSLISCPTGALTGGPYGTSAVFFGGQTANSVTALMWQFVASNSADYDNADYTHWTGMGL